MAKGFRMGGSQAPGLAEQMLRDANGGESEPIELKDQVEHWVRVIDRWVQRLDEGMGGTTDGAEPAVAPESAPEAASDSPAFEAG